MKKKSNLLMNSPPKVSLPETIFRSYCNKYIKKPILTQINKYTIVRTKISLSWYDKQNLKILSKGCREL